MIPIGPILKSLAMSNGGPGPHGIVKRIIVVKTPEMEEPEVQASVQPLDPEEIKKKMLRLEREAIERREQEIEDELGEEEPEDKEVEDKRLLVSGT